MRIAIAFLLFLSGLARAGEVQPIGICEILKDPAPWNGKMIEVTGPIVSVQDYWVMGTGCDGMLEVKSTKFLSGFVLEYPSNKATHYHKVNFDWDQASRAELNTLADEAKRTKRKVIATVVGMFETQVPIDKLIDMTAPYKYRGFGHMGGAPGQIIVKTIKNMRIEEKGPLAR